MKLYVRNEKHEIIGFREVLEEHEKVNILSDLENKLHDCRRQRIMSEYEKNKFTRKMFIEYYDNKIIELINEINRIYDLPSYRHEILFNFNTQPEQLEFVSFVPESKKQKIKTMNTIYKMQRESKKHSDNRPITLDPENYK